MVGGWGVVVGGRPVTPGFSSGRGRPLGLCVPLRRAVGGCGALCAGGGGVCSGGTFGLRGGGRHCARV